MQLVSYDFSSSSVLFFCFVLFSDGCKALNDEKTWSQTCVLCADRAFFTKLLQIYLIDTSGRMML